MDSPRTALVAMLIAVELLIVGLAIWVIGGTHASLSAAGLQPMHFKAGPIAPLDAGASPHIVVDDPDSRVEIGVSSDGRVHVADLTRLFGGLFSSSRTIAQLTVRRTADGVRIERPDEQAFHWSLGGGIDRKIEVDVPSASRIEIGRCSGADVKGIAGGVSVRSQDGHITLANLTGNVDARSNDGYVSAADVRGDALTVESSDGHLSLQNITVGALVARTNDGHIEAARVSLAGAQPRATFHTGDGSIRLGLAAGTNLSLDASTQDGRIDVDGSSYRSDGPTHHTIRLGSGAGSARVSTQDGSIHITTNGAP